MFLPLHHEDRCTLALKRFASLEEGSFENFPFSEAKLAFSVLTDKGGADTIKASRTKWNQTEKLQMESLLPNPKGTLLKT